MPRLFVAAELPDRARDRLLGVRPAAFPGVRLVGREEMHLTLHFVGEVEDGQIAAVRRALDGVKAPPFAIDLDGVGRFPPQGVARVLWAGVRANPKLSALHQALGTALAAAIGFRLEGRPYQPHVTLARLDVAPPPGTVEDYLRVQAAFHATAVPVTQFSLYSSVLTPDGPQYQVEAAFNLSLVGPPAATAGLALHLVYLGDGRMLLTKKVYRDWREIQDEYRDYTASLGPWSEAEVVESLEFEYPDLAPIGGRVRSFVRSDSEVLVL